MSQQPEDQKGIVTEELSPEDLTGNANIAIPVNAAIAADVLSDGATAAADATQDTDVEESQ